MVKAAMSRAAEKGAVWDGAAQQHSTLLLGPVQQEPVPDTGDYFKREWLLRSTISRRGPARGHGGSDYAVTADGGDPNVAVASQRRSTITGSIGTSTGASYPTMNSWNVDACGGARGIPNGRS